MRKLIYFSLGLLLFSTTIMAQHTIVKNDGSILTNVKITEISDSTLTFQQGVKKDLRTETIGMQEVKYYKLQDGIIYHVGQPVVLPEPVHDTILSIVKDTVETTLLLKYADNQNKALAKALKTTGTISMAIGVPCVAAGIASLLYAELIPNPTNGYTTSKVLAEESDGLQYITVNEYVNKLQDYNGKVRAAQNAGYLFTGAGAALTIVGIPLYCYGNHLMKLTVNYTGNGAGVVVNF